MARPKKPWTLGEAFEVTCRSIWNGTKSEKTSTINGRLAVDHFGASTPIHHIDHESLNEWALHLSGLGNSDATVNRKMAAFSRIYRTAYDSGRTDGAPKPALPRRREYNTRLRFFSSDEEERLVGQFRYLEWDLEADFITFLLDTGLRTYSEGLKVSYEDATLLDGERPYLHVWESKGDEFRVVPLTKRAAAIVKARANGSLPLFKGLTKSAFRHKWDRVRGNLGFGDDPQFIPYTLRHTTASRLVQRGVALAVIQKWMGHKTIQVTLRYAKLRPDDVLNAVNVLENE